ncbi:MAG: di-heme oxidoredictase family protein [Magnetospiraceae bacterium]
MFQQTGCAACHRPELVTANGKTFTPFTDLLLHDMGPGLADGIGEGVATGREWRTAPLWGLGAATRFLHDGRARTLTEAIELHDGEGAGARHRFRALTPADQDRLLEFLKAL